MELLVAHGLRTIIDFRDEKEAGKDTGPRKLLSHFKDHGLLENPTIPVGIPITPPRRLMRVPYVRTSKIALQLISRLSWVELGAVTVRFAGGFLFRY